MTKFVANFDGEYFGKQLKAGDEIILPKGEDETALDGPITDGRVSRVGDGDQVSPALGSTDTNVSDGGPLDHDGDGKAGGSKPRAAPKS